MIWFLSGFEDPSVCFGHMVSQSVLASAANEVVVACHSHVSCSLLSKGVDYIYWNW